jgi:energy-coupling factor transporter ATP-binding protein EcfA2
MHGRTRSALLAYGIGSELVEKINIAQHTVEQLRVLSRSELLGSYTEEEVELLKSRLIRTPIDPGVVENIVAKATGVCCYCADGNHARPFQLHHIDPYSQTQDNSEVNLLLVCPTHHEVIHLNKTSREEQKTARRRWYSTVDVASDFRAKGLPFPFGVFQPLDYASDPRPAELVEFAPPSPSTTLLSLSPELAAAAEERLEQSSFLLILGQSGSGKSTFATALGGRFSRNGHRVFRARVGRQESDTLKQIALFVSTCSRAAVLILDDANTWASSRDVQEIAKIVANHRNIHIITTWTSDDSEHTSRLLASDLPKQILIWEELKPAVIETLLKFEGEVVGALQRFEHDRSVGALGVGSMHRRLKERISILGDKPKSVYEFIFGLRGDACAFDEELRDLVQNDRSDIPVLCAAVEQLAGFERTISVAGALNVCRRLETISQLPKPSPEWVHSVFEQQVNNRRLVRIRDQYTTIHRRWAARLIAAALKLTTTKAQAEQLLALDFNVESAEPGRVLRLWSWLTHLDDSRPFIRAWEKSLSEEQWVEFVTRCARTDLAELGAIADRLQLLFKGDGWLRTLERAFKQNADTTRNLIHAASPSDWYSVREVAFVMARACPEQWQEILTSWNRKSLAGVLLNTDPSDFDDVSWALGTSQDLCPNLMREVGSHISWKEFAPRLNLVSPGDAWSLCSTFGMFGTFGHKLRRSMLRDLTESLGNILGKASIDDLRFRESSAILMVIPLYFPQDFRRALSRIDVSKMARQMELSLPRHWRSLCALGTLARDCESTLVGQLVEACDREKLVQQVGKYALDNRYEFRLLLHFLCGSESEIRTWFADALKPVVNQSCKPNDSEAESIISAYVRLHNQSGMALAQNLGIKVDSNEISQLTRAETEELELEQAKFREKDIREHDYDIEFDTELTE